LSKNWTDEWHIDVPDGPSIFDLGTIVINELNQIYTDDVDFDIIGDELSVNHPFIAKVTVLGSAISTSSCQVPVTVKIQIGTQSYTPFGSFGSPTTGNVNDANNPRVFEAPDVFEASDVIAIGARSWLKRRSDYSGRGITRHFPFGFRLEPIQARNVSYSNNLRLPRV